MENTEFKITPTVFFIRKNGILKQVVMARIENGSLKNKGRIEVRIANEFFEISLDSAPFYLGQYIIGVPEVSQPTSAEFTLITTEKKKYSDSVIIRPSRHWKIYMTPHTHLDIGYTDLQDRVWEFQAKNLDKVISLCQETRDWPEGSSFKWTCEVSRLVKNYLEKRPPEKIEELRKLIKEGKIEVAALYLNEHTDLTGHEELIRLVYYANRLRKEFGIKINSVMLDDVVGYTWALPQVLSRAGIKYLALRANPYQAAPLWQKASGRNFATEVPRWKAVSRPFFWKSPSGDKILTWYADSYREGNFLRHASGSGLDRPIGCNTNSFEGIISEIISRNEKVGYPYDALQLRMGGDNIDAVITPCLNAKEWNERWAYPKVIMATNSEFFQYLEKNCKDEFPVFCGDIPTWWADGPLSLARETGINRTTHDELTAAEKLSALAHLLNGGYEYPDEDIDKAYDKVMLADEHTGGATESITKPYSLQTLGQWAVKSSYSYEAAIRVKSILKDALDNIACQIKAPGEATVVAFNSLSWKRSDVVYLNIPTDLLAEKVYFQLIDISSGKNLPYQIIEKGENSIRIAYFAQDIPPLGYRVYKILPSSKLPEFTNNISISDKGIENRFYKILIDPVTGGIKSIFDKQLNQEIVDKESPYKVNQYIYEKPRDTTRKGFHFFRTAVNQGGISSNNIEERTEFHRSSPTSASFIPEMKGPVMGSVLINTSGECSPQITQKVVLYQDLKRIDFINTLRKEETLEEEGVYYAFPFKVKNPTFKFEIPNAIFSPEVDQMNGSAKDYYSIQHWLDVSNHDYGVTWATIEAPVIELCHINTRKWLKKLKITNSTFFSWMMNNYWDTNWKASQGGDLTFRYSITTHRGDYDPVRATHFGWNYSNSLMGLCLPKNEKGSLPAKELSFCQIDKPNVNLLVIKRAEDKKGYILRLQEIEGKKGVVKVTFPYFRIDEAYLTDIVEENIEPLNTQGNTIIIPMQQFDITTVRVMACSSREK